MSRFFASARATHLAYALALSLGLATIVIGFYSDDWALIATLEGKVHAHASPLDLYRFGTGDPAETRALVVRGPWPWWTLPELRLHFFRPLSSALFALDHALFGHTPVGWHLHAVVWWLLFVAAARAVYRRTLRRTVLWLGLGALSGIPVGLSGFPGSRVLMLPSVGAFAVLALLVERTLLEARRAPVTAGVFVALHGLLGPLLFATGVAMHARMARATERATETLTIPPPVPKRVYVLVASDPMAAFYASAVRLVRAERDFSAWSILSMSKRPHRVTRTGDTSLRLETPEGTLFDGGFVDVYRARAYPMQAGDVVGLDGGSVTVLTATAGAPTAIELVLDVPLDDPTIAILAWQDGALRPVELTIGASTDIVWSPGPTLLF